ncbi:MAG: nucleotidyl transferase AbiEii/AbiGii toxin family protein [Polyangiaceae bacterium]
MGAYFAGGTRIALDLGEYRESRDVDFLCSDAGLYAELRLLVRERGYDAIFARKGALELPREIRADQYGVRFPAMVRGVSLRVEIVREARFSFHAPDTPDWSPVDCLSIGDCFTAKLLANCDRWPDKDTLARDLLDLAALRHAHGPIPDRSWAAAESAYRRIVRADLGKAAKQFLDDRAFQTRCFSGLSVRENMTEPLLDAVRLLDIER